MIIIGLTGSIGTGKSTVTKQFAQCGALTLDSDAVVHSLLGPGGGAVNQVAKLFPETLVNGWIDRKALGAEVFGDKARRNALEAVIHPLVRLAQDRFLYAARHNHARMVVLDVPLLFETYGDERCDVTVVTTAPLYLQRQRVFARPHMTQEKFERIVAAQMPTPEKIRRADFVVRTGMGKHESLKGVKWIILRLLKKGDSIRL